MAEQAEDSKDVPVSAIFALEELVSPAFRSGVVSRVLNEFTNLPENARQSLRSAVNDDITLTTGSFRKGQAGRALEGMRTILLEPMEREIQISAKLASSVLRCWAESHPSLREATERHLEVAGFPVQGPDFSSRRFRDTWPVDQWRSQLQAFSQEHHGFTEDEVGLMLCFVSGNLPLLPESESLEEAGSEALSSFLEFLRQLPATAPQWGQEIPNFAASVSQIIEEKSAQLRWATDFETHLEALRREFRELLEFFEQDTDGWSAARVSHVADTAAALALVENLNALLSEYRPIHERATGISEERERIQRRLALQPSILEALQDIDALMTEDSGDGPVESQDAMTMPAAPEPTALLSSELPPSSPREREIPQFAAEPPTPLPTGRPRPLIEKESSAGERPVAVVETPSLTSTEFESLQSENSGLRDNTYALRSENENLRVELEGLKSELFDTQEMEESWRLAYLATKDGEPATTDRAAPHDRQRKGCSRTGTRAVQAGTDFRTQLGVQL